MARIVAANFPDHIISVVTAGRKLFFKAKTTGFEQLRT